MDLGRMHPDARAVVERLGLAPHPEGGFYRETFRAPLSVVGAGGARRAASTAIYFLLPAGSFSALHRVASDEVWHHYGGDPVDLHLIGEARAGDAPQARGASRSDGDGGHRVARLGGGDGAEPQIVVPAGVLQAAVPVGERYALCGCTVAPGFDFADFEIPSRGELLARFPAHRELIVALTRA